MVFNVWCTVLVIVVCKVPGFVVCLVAGFLFGYMLDVVSWSLLCTLLSVLFRFSFACMNRLSFVVMFGGTCGQVFSWVFVA